MSLEITPTHPSADSYVSLSEANAYIANRTDTTEWNALTDAQKEQLLRMATRQIDTFRYVNNKFYDSAREYRLEQSLKFPRTGHPSKTGVVDTATTSTIVSGDLADNINLPDDYFNDGAIVIIAGIGKGQTKLVTDFVSLTGTVTISGTWTTTPDSTSQFRIIKAIPEEVKNATIEQALALSKGLTARADLQAQGVTSYSIGDLSETFANASGSEAKLSSESLAWLNGLITRIGRFI